MVFSAHVKIFTLKKQLTYIIISLSIRKVPYAITNYYSSRRQTNGLHGGSHVEEGRNRLLLVIGNPGFRLCHMRHSLHEGRQNGKYFPPCPPFHPQLFGNAEPLTHTGRRKSSTLCHHLLYPSRHQILRCHDFRLLPLAKCPADRRGTSDPAIVPHHLFYLRLQGASGRLRQLRKRNR